MLVEPQAEGVLHHARDERRRLAGRQALLGLPGELRLLHLHREDEGDPLPDVLGRQLDAARQQVAELAEFAHGVEQALAQAVHMGAALGRGNQVDVAFLHRLTALGQPQQGPAHRFLGTFEVAAEGFIGQARQLGDRVGQVGAQAVLEVPLDALAGVLVLEHHAQARAQHRLGLEHMLEAADRELRRIEILRIRPEMHAGTGIALADRADDFQVAVLEAVGEGHPVLVGVALDAYLDPGRERVHHRDADPVQAAGELVVLVRELAAGMQLGKDQLDARHALFRVDVHRHAAAVVDDFQRVVLVQDHLHALRVAGQGFVDAVVDDFLGQVVGAGGVGVHPRALAHRVEAGKDFDGVCVVSSHGVSIQSKVEKSVSRHSADG